MIEANLPLYAFVFIGLFSPGPNIVLLTASGARFGVRATLPHLLGVALGVGVIAGVVALGLGALLLATPALLLALKVIAAAWILRMAWGLWWSNPGKANERDRPMRFLDAVLFQWVNPKLWAVALSAVTLHSVGLPPVLDAVRHATAFSGINLGICLFWTFAGTLLAQLLTSPVAWIVFTRVMALALAGFSVMLAL